MTSEQVNADEPTAPTTADAPAGGGQASEGPSGFGNAETAVGGADAVPGTPDALPDAPGLPDADG